MKRLLFNCCWALALAGCATSHAPDQAHIVAPIAACAKYEAMNPHFAKAFAFLKRPDLKDLPVGRYEIDGANCWATIQEANLTPLADSKLECHRKYIDIQAPLTGDETMGLYTMTAKDLARPFDEKRDCVLFKAPMDEVTVHPGEFVLFFAPRGAHAPGHVASGPSRKIRKLVIKVRAR